MNALALNAHPQPDERSPERAIPYVQAQLRLHVDRLRLTPRDAATLVEADPDRFAAALAGTPDFSLEDLVRMRDRLAMLRS